MATRTLPQDTPASKTELQDVESSALDRAVGAAFIASGVGALVLGIVIALTEMPSMASFKSALAWNGGVGPLSGKTGLSVIAFVLSWVGLHFFFKNRPIALTKSFTISIVLIVLGLLLSFPPVFEIFAG